MSANFLDHSDSIRLGAFFSVLLVMTLWEVLSPRRIQIYGRLARWPSNLALVLLDALVVRLLIPAGLAGFAAYAATQTWGIFNLIGPPGWLAVIASVLILDLVIYLQHVAFHAVPAFWRLHRMHHSDLEIDVTTGIRFHPIEIFFSVLVKTAAIAIIGAPAVSVLAFEVLLNGMSMFNHSNVRLPERLDMVLRPLLVTPEMHRVHHSIVRAETDSNYGFNLSVWDRMFGTYRQEPAAGQLGMTIGIAAFREPEELRLDKMLTQPFRET